MAARAARASQGDRVRVHYLIRSQDGSVASSRGREPLEVTVGVDHAADEARQAVRAAEDGDWGPASLHAHHACLIESAHEAPLLWGPLERAIEKAAR